MKDPFSFARGAPERDRTVTSRHLATLTPASPTGAPEASGRFEFHEAPTRPLAVGLDAPRVLVADDNEDARQLYGDYLALLGYDVTLAENGRRAVDAALAKKPDVVVMDLAMPVMDGIEAMKLLRADERTRDLPILVLTAWPGTLGEAAGRLAQERIDKPCVPEELERAVRRVLGKARVRDAL